MVDVAARLSAAGQRYQAQREGTGLQAGGESPFGPSEPYDTLI